MAVRSVKCEDVCLRACCLVASSAILRILLSDIGWLPVAGLLKPIVLIDLFMPQRTQENQPIDLAVRNNTTYHTADGIKISNMFG